VTASAAAAGDSLTQAGRLRMSGILRLGVACVWALRVRSTSVTRWFSPLVGVGVDSTGSLPLESSLEGQAN